MSGPPAFRVAEIALEPDESHTATLSHLQAYVAALPVALEGLVSMWTPHGWHGTLDGRPVSGNLDGFDDATEGGIVHSAGIEQHGTGRLQVIILASFGLVDTIKITAQAMTQERADEIAEAVAEAWRRPPPTRTGTTNLERVGRRDTRLWAARVALRRAVKPTGFVGGLVSGLLVGAVLSVLGFTGALEDAVRWLLGVVGL